MRLTVLIQQRAWRERACGGGQASRSVVNGSRRTRRRLGVHRGAQSPFVARNVCDWLGHQVLFNVVVAPARSFCKGRRVVAATPPFLPNARGGRNVKVVKSVRNSLDGLVLPKEYVVGLGQAQLLLIGQGRGRRLPSLDLGEEIPEKPGPLLARGDFPLQPELVRLRQRHPLRKAISPVVRKGKQKSFPAFCLVFLRREPCRPRTPPTRRACRCATRCGRDC